MSLEMTIGFCVVLVGVIGFAARMAVEGEPMDVLTLVALAAAAGYMVTKL